MSEPLSRRSFLRRAASAVAVASLPAMQVAPQIEELAIRPVEGEMEVMNDVLLLGGAGQVIADTFSDSYIDALSNMVPQQLMDLLVEKLLPIVGRSVSLDPTPGID